MANPTAEQWRQHTRRPPWLQPPGELGLSRNVSPHGRGRPASAIIWPSGRFPHPSLNAAVARWACFGPRLGGRRRTAAIAQAGAGRAASGPLLSGDVGGDSSPSRDPEPDPVLATRPPAPIRASPDFARAGRFWSPITPMPTCWYCTEESSRFCDAPGPGAWGRCARRMCDMHTTRVGTHSDLCQEHAGGDKPTPSDQTGRSQDPETWAVLRNLVKLRPPVDF